jgi:aromatic ring-cleaving dioxygenase
MKINYYHFHLYYNLSNIKLATGVVENLGRAFDIKVGRLWEGPVGPHPVCSCQVTVPLELFEKVTACFLNNRKGFDLFIHPVTGDSIADHTDSTMWMGKSYKLNTNFFETLLKPITKINEGVKCD